jgi:biotin carboxyl carrier protein
VKFLLEPIAHAADGGASPAERACAVEPNGDGFTVTLDGAPGTVEGIVGAETRALVDGRPVLASVRREGDLVVVELHGLRHEFRVRDARAPRLARRRHEEVARNEVHAPMPGLVVELMVAVGDRVDAGAAVIVVEAMKMQNALPAPLSGRVAAIAVTPGTAVDSGALLLTITPEEG